MGNAAILLGKQGVQVAGSDAGVYPPMSDVLADAGIELFFLPTALQDSAHE